MSIIGFHVSHEQFSPKEALDLVIQAEKAGFEAAMCSDHIVPWNPRQGQSGHNWTWLGAAMHATSLPFSSLAIPGNFRYHPAVVAHCVATLAQMFPGRFRWIAAGSGEAMNEHIVAAGWPDKAERNARLKAAVDIIRALWRGDTVTTDRLIPTDRAKLWSLPDTPPKIYGPALSLETAQWLGSWADGLLTVHQDPQDLQKIIDAFRRGGGNGKPIAVQVHVSWADTDDEARYNAWDQWRSNAVGRNGVANLEMPEDFDRAAKDITPDDMDQVAIIASDPTVFVRRIQEYIDMGVDELMIHNSGRNQTEFLEMFGKHVLPRVTDHARKAA